MTKQKEIGEWFCKYLAQFNGQLDYGKLPQHRKDTYKMMVEEDIMSYLHSQGAELRTKCPDCEWSQFEGELAGMTPCHSCNSTGYIMESLIKEA